MRISDWSQTCALPICSCQNERNPMLDSRPPPTGQPIDAVRHLLEEPLLKHHSRVVSGNASGREIPSPHSYRLSRESLRAQIGSAQGRERVCPYVKISVVSGSLQKENKRHEKIL